MQEQISSTLQTHLHDNNLPITVMPTLERVWQYKLSAVILMIWHVLNIMFCLQFQTQNPGMGPWKQNLEDALSGCQFDLLVFDRSFSQHVSRFHFHKGDNEENTAPWKKLNGHKCKFLVQSTLGYYIIDSYFFPFLFSLIEARAENVNITKNFRAFWKRMLVIILSKPWMLITNKEI